MNLDPILSDIRSNSARAAVIVSLLVCALSRSVVGQPSPEPSTDFWFTDGAVNAIATGDKAIYIGGSFSYIGPQTGPAAAFDLYTGAYVGRLPRVNGTLYAIEADGQGGWFVGGEFSQIGGLALNHLAHIFADLSLDPGFNAQITGSGIYALARAGERLYIAGQFTKLGTTSQQGVAALRISDGSLEAWNPQVSGRVNSIFLSDEVLYLGGQFTTVAGKTRNRLAAVEIATANLTPWDPGANNSVFTVKAADGLVYVGGQFTTAGGKPRNRVAAIDATNGEATTWNPNPNGIVRVLEIAEDEIYAGGEFTTVGVQNRNKFAGISRTTGAVLPIDLQVEGSGSQIWSIRALGDILLVGGNFARIQGTKHPLITAADLATGEAAGATPLGINYNGSSDNAIVTAIAVSGGRLLCAGSFESLGGVARTNAAALDASTGRVLPWSIAPSSPVLALAYSPDRLYVGGAFAQCNETTVSGLAAVDPATGELQEGWQFKATNGAAAAQIKSLLLADTRLYVGGAFSRLGEVSVRVFGAVNPADGTALTFDAKVVGGSAGVTAIARSAGNLYIAGDFATVGGQSRTRLAAVSEAQGQVSSWNPAPNRDVDCLAVTQDRLYVGGLFTSIAGIGLRNAAVFSIPSHELVSFDPTLGSSSAGVTGIASTETAVYFAGSFDSIGGEFRKTVACLNPASALAYDWNPSPSAVPQIIALTDEFVCLGGSFRTVGTSPNLHPIANFAVFHRSPMILAHEVAGGKLVITGTTGDRSRAIFHSTANLKTWMPLATNAPGEHWTRQQPIEGSQQFFRITGE